MQTVFLNIWRKASFLFVVIMLLWCYKTLPDSIAFSHNDLGEPIAWVDKQTFFYAATAIIVIFNLLMGLAKTAISKLDFSKLNPASEWANAKESLSQLIEGWFNAFSAFVNTTLVFIFLGLNGINRTAEQMLDKNYNWLLIFLTFVLMILVFFLPLRILFTQPKQN